MRASGTTHSFLFARTPTQPRTSGILRKLRLLASLTLALAAAMAGLQPAAAADGPPNYVLTYLGTGTPAAINNHGTVVGAKINGSSYAPLVSSNGSRWVPLPIPAGAQKMLGMPNQGAEDSWEAAEGSGSPSTNDRQASTMAPQTSKLSAMLKFGQV